MINTILVKYGHSSVREDPLNRFIHMQNTDLIKTIMRIYPMKITNIKRTRKIQILKQSPPQ